VLPETQLKKLYGEHLWCGPCANMAKRRHDLHKALMQCSMAAEEAATAASKASSQVAERINVNSKCARGPAFKVLGNLLSSLPYSLLCQAGGITADLFPPQVSL